MIKLDGKEASQKVKDYLRREVEELKEVGIQPKLTLIKVGQDPASKIYVNNKIKACEEVGIKSDVIEFEGGLSQEFLLKVIRALNEDDKVHGILVQLPLPDNIDTAVVANAISPDKDVDCFNPVNVGRFYSDDKCIMEPCTPGGIMLLLEQNFIDVEGYNAVVVGRSNIVGKPMAHMLSRANATVTMCHSKTEPKTLAKALKEADIIVSAVGKPKFITKDMLGKDQVLIDVGMNKDENGKLCGDIDPEAYENSMFYTPVPGGVGPMTVAQLLINCVSAAKEISECVK